MFRYLFLLIFILFFSTSCQQILLPKIDYQCNRVLTEEEMIPPVGVYQPGVNLERTRRVNFDAPMTKPKLEWNKVIGEGAILLQCESVDGLGGTWYVERTNTKVSYSNVLYRLDSSGAISAQKKFPISVFEAKPVISLKGAVICAEIIVDTEISKTMENCTPLCLECIDLKGKTVWRTETFCMNAGLRVVRIPNNLIMLLVNLPEMYQYNIYSLADGTLHDSFVIPDSDPPFGMGPYQLHDGSWITVQSKRETDLLTRFDNNMNIFWSNESPISKSSPYAPFISGEVAAVGYRGYLRGINIHNGTTAWEKKGEGGFIPVGIMPDGDFLVHRYSSKGSWFSIVTVNGQIKKNNFYSGIAHYIDYTELVIYKDGKILFGLNDGIALLDSNGTLIWKIDSNSLGTDDKETLRHWQVNPLPDGRIVASCDMSNDENYYIFSFR